MAAKLPKYAYVERLPDHETLSLAIVRSHIGFPYRVLLAAFWSFLILLPTPHGYIGNRSSEKLIIGHQMAYTPRVIAQRK
jgi:hypothetical protein